MSDASRARTAPRAVASSDVTRFRGVLAAAIAAAIGVIGIAVTAVGLDGVRSPGALSPAHRDAAIECAGCHASDAPVAACVSCHGAHESARPGHAALRARGELGCTSCHRAHDARGLTFAPDGTVTVFADGRARSIDAETSFRPARAVHVPWIEREACTSCHDASAPHDPLAVCGSGAVTCFDEHRRGDVLPSGEASSVPRSAAWEAARVVLATRDIAPAPTYWPWLAVLGASVLGLVVLVAARRRARPSEPARVVRVPTRVEKVRLPRIDPSTCLGCHACVDACPYDVLAVEKYVAVVVRPKDCCGLTLCAQVCPNGSLRVDDGAPIADRPRVSDSLESLDQPGLYLAGDLTGAPLIRNAIDQGALVVRAIAAEPRARGSALDVVIVGAGPAGLSAALEAEARGLRYEVLEQASVAESIRSFPRGKLVIDQPLALPRAGELWLEQSTKEELLAKWQRIVRRERLRIREHHRVTSIERGDAGAPFTVRALDAEGRPIELSSARVVLAMGRRGTPRKLEVDIPDEALDRVHYSLADARSHAGARVVVVGLGDVAMEAAIALARQPGTRVTVVYRGEGFARGKARNISELQRLARDGRVAILFGATVEEVGRDEIALSVSGAEHRVRFDALFVMIGSLPPWPFLEAAGVRRTASSM